MTEIKEIHKIKEKSCNARSRKRRLVIVIGKIACTEAMKKLRNLTFHDERRLAPGLALTNDPCKGRRKEKIENTVT